MKEVEDENALKHMFDKAHLNRTADVNNVGGTETRPGGFEVLSYEEPSISICNAQSELI